MVVSWAEINGVKLNHGMLNYLEMSCCKGSDSPLLAWIMRAHKFYSVTLLQGSMDPGHE